MLESSPSEDLNVARERLYFAPKNPRGVVEAERERQRDIVQTEAARTSMAAREARRKLNVRGLLYTQRGQGSVNKDALRPADEALYRKPKSGD